METFKTYAHYYDSIYSGKEYNREAEFIQDILAEFGTKKIQSVMSLGCGTATFDILLAKRGFEITGIDASQEMIDIAKEKATQAGADISFAVADMVDCALPKSQDAVLAMFNVVGYLTENSAVEKCFANVAKNLEQSGLFAFDCWYGPAVVKDPPQNRIKEFLHEGKTIVRTTTQTVEPANSLINISFSLSEKGKEGILAKETHVVRYWNAGELEDFLERAGFEVLKTCVFLEKDKPVSEDNWNIFVIAKKK